MTASINTEDLARSLNISVLSVELRIWRMLLLMGYEPEPKVSKLGFLDLVEAKLLGLLELSDEEARELMRELSMKKA
jgi:hypothetical protein